MKSYTHEERIYSALQRFILNFNEMRELVLKCMPIKFKATFKWRCKMWL